MMKKVAIVCILKNEYAVLPSWLCWHKLLGFDNFIIFDDGSTDGSMELLLAAREHYNIELFNASMFEFSEYICRQEESYKFTIEKYKDKFEWLLFIDADEFVSFSNMLNVSEFLERHSDVDGIAINWCQYGSNGHVLDPQGSIVDAYTRHGLAEGIFASHVKSFVRPDMCTSRWINVHCFDLSSDRYVDASGNAVEWGDTPGISARAPDWSVAKIMHFQVRSMQSFVERTKKHKNLKYTTEVFRQLDTNYIEDKSPLQLSKAMNGELKKLQEIFDRFLFKKISDRMYSSILKDDNLTSDLQIYIIKSFHDTYIHYQVADKRLIHGAELCPQGKDQQIMYVLKVLHWAFFIILRARDQYNITNEFFEIIGIAKMANFETTVPNRFSFSTIGDGKFYSAEVGTGRVSADKTAIEAWETFQLIDPKQLDSLQRGICDWKKFVIEINSHRDRAEFEATELLSAVDTHGIISDIRKADRDDVAMIFRYIGLPKGYASAICNNRIF